MSDETTTTLITEIKQRGMVPTSQRLYENSDFLRLATQEMDLYMVPMILNAREEFFTWNIDQTLTSSNNEYEINERAISGLLRALFWTQSGTSNFIPVPYLDPDQRNRAASGMLNSIMFYLQWNKIVIAANPGGGTLRQVIYMRPGRLTEVENCGQITAINTSTNTVTLSLVPSGFVANAVVDFISSRNMHAYLGIDFTISSVSGFDLVFTSLPSGLSIGDWVCPQYQSCIVQIPRELFPLLCMKTATTILLSLGDPKWQQADQEVKRLEAAAINLINPRVSGADKVIVSNMSPRAWWY